jgi:YspA, cpYpsA-related SLOG family
VTDEVFPPTPQTSPEPFRLLVTGSRDWTRTAAVWAELLKVWNGLPEGQPLIVVHGDARGADSHAKSWAAGMARHGYLITEESHPADWDTHGKSAGFLRNEAMVGLGADLCLAFIMPCQAGGRCRTRRPHGSHGAAQCAEKAAAAGIPVRTING